MGQTLTITPEGVQQTMPVGITDMEQPAGKNSVIVLNDTYSVAHDGTYENVE
jgi:hypothetical protein